MFIPWFLGAISQGTMRLLKIRQGMLKALQHGLANSEHHLVAVGAILFFGFPLFYWLWSECFPQPWESLSLRIVGSLMGLGLFLVPFWPEKIKPFLPWYWFATLLFALSFFSAYSFLMNQASVVSAMSLLSSVFLLVLLLMDLPALIIILLTGWGLAFAAHYMNSSFIYYGEEHIEMLILVLFVIVAATVFNRKTALLQAQRLEGMVAAAGMIAHELRTPLLGIKSGALAMSHYIPLLLNAFHLAKEKGLLEHTPRESRVQQIGEITQRIINESDYAATIIDMLLIKAGHNNALKNCALEECSMASCIAETLARYPYKSARHKSLITWQGDFAFQGSPVLMQHVLFNLIKNAFYAIDAAGKGEISIWVAAGEKGHILYFMDTAQGMSKEQLSRLFKPFYSTTFMGTGLGLSFCKMVMNHFGGDIVCESVQGEYTRFMLIFN